MKILEKIDTKKLVTIAVIGCLVIKLVENINKKTVVYIMKGGPNG